MISWAEPARPRLDQRLSYRAFPRPLHDEIRPAAPARILHGHKRLHGPEWSHHERVRSVATDETAGGAEVISAKDDQRHLLRRVVDAQGGREVHLAFSTAEADGRIGGHVNGLGGA